MSVLFIYFAIDLSFTLEINNQRLAAVLPLTVLSIDPIREIRSDLVSRDRRTICREVPETLFQWTSRVYEPLKPRFARSLGGYAVRYIYLERKVIPRCTWKPGLEVLPGYIQYVLFIASRLFLARRARGGGHRGGWSPLIHLALS